MLKEKKNPSEMTDEEFLEYLSSLGTDEKEDIIDEGAEGEPSDTAGESEEASDAESEPSDAETTADDKTVDESLEDKSGDEPVKEEPAALHDGGAVSSVDVGNDGEPAAAAEPSSDTARIISEWQAQEKILKKSVPNFDLRKALENPQFKKMLIEDGMDVIDAYEAINPKASKELPVLDEVGRSVSGSSGVTSHDVSSMSDDEFDRYIKRLQEED